MIRTSKSLLFRCATGMDGVVYQQMRASFPVVRQSLDVIALENGKAYQIDRIML